jgi:integrase
MTVYDRWHKVHPGPAGELCREHSRGSTRLYLSADHGKGDRWQVRWRDQNGIQRKRNFARKTGTDPEKSADAFDAKTRTQLDDGSYIDPSSANVTLKVFAEDWRRTRTHDRVTADRIERELRLHVYPAIGHRTLRELEKRPSLTQAWIAGMKLAPLSARQVIRDVSAVYVAAVDDRLITRNPLLVKSVTRPKVDERKVQPWTLAQVEAMARVLPARFAVLPYLGAGTGMRQGELFGLAVDEVDFRHKVVHVRRQVRLIGDVACFAPVKNNKAHDVPLSDALAPLLADHIRRYPPVPVTLPWKEPGGKPVTFTLLVTRPGAKAMSRTRFNESHWRPGREKAGIVPAPKPGEKRAPAREHGMHVLRHTAASAWLTAGVDIAAVAAWLGDTVQTVHETYAHMMPGADERGRRAMDEFFTRPGGALHVPSEGDR